MANYDFQSDVLPLKNVLFRLALRITLSPEEAEDVVQETMMKVWSRREAWPQIESMEAFCLTICRNLAVDRNRKKGRAAASLDDEEASEPADHSYTADPERRTVDGDRMSLLRRLMASLPEKQRSIMQLRDIEGMSYKDIAAALAISEDQVKVGLFRARQTIKKKFIDTDSYGL